METVLKDNDQIEELDKIINKINLEDIHNNEIKKIYNKDFKPNKSPKYLTIYEYTAIIGKRASQIQDNAPILITNYSSLDSPIDIAKKELTEGKIPFIIRRPLPNGTYEDVTLNNLVIREEF
jgi:DNA-directed RNA polymerase I, II, and III subunit RPABC2